MGDFALEGQERQRGFTADSDGLGARAAPGLGGTEGDGVDPVGPFFFDIYNLHQASSSRFMISSISRVAGVPFSSYNDFPLNTCSSTASS